MNTQPNAEKKSDLIPRVLTAVVMVPILFFLIFQDSHWFWFSIIAPATAIGLFEVHGMLLKSEPPWVRLAVSGVGLALFLVVYLFVGQKAPLTPLLQKPDQHLVLLFLVLASLIWFSFLFHLFRDRDMAIAHLSISGSIAGTLYVALGFLFVALLKRDFVDGSAWVILALGLCWFSDTGAYLVGRKWGKHKLSPKVSPNKSVEGALGGLLGSILAALLFSWLWLPQVHLWHALLLAIPANVLAQTGDLSESLLKRSTKVKDSGTIIYGHGGMLDRVDAVIFVAPYVYFFVYFFQLY